MAEISKITALDGTTYDLKDITARQNIPFGIVDSTSTATAFTATVPGITSLEDGTCMLLKNGVVTSASGFTININNLGAKPAYSNMSAATAETTLFNENYTMLFVYDSTRVEGGAWILYRGYNSNDNTIGYQLRTNSSKLKSSDACRYYKIFFTSADGTTFVPASATKTNNATAARAVNQRPINPFGSIIYYSTTTNFSAGTALSATAMWEQYTVTLGYSFNTTGAALTLTVDAPVYVKCAPQTDGSAIIDSTNPIVQSLPTTADRKIYIFLGLAYSATQIELNVHHPVYYHDGTGIKLWMGKEIKEYESKTAASGGTDVSLVTTGEKYTWNNKISNHIGVCSVAANVAEKTVQCTTITELIDYTFINVIFTYGNSLTNITLNVNNTGAKSVMVTFDGNTAESTLANMIWPSGIVTFMYLSNNWWLLNPNQMASTTNSGLMSSSDKSKLDNLNKFYLTDTTPASASSGDLWFIIEEEETIIPGQGDQNASEPSYP